MSCFGSAFKQLLPPALLFVCISVNDGSIRHKRNVTGKIVWRPISLINVDYKLLSGVLVLSIKQGLNRVIRETKTGFLLKSFHCRENESGVWTVLYTEVIETYNFANDFMKWFQTL